MRTYLIIATSLVFSWPLACPGEDAAAPPGATVPATQANLTVPQRIGQAIEVTEALAAKAPAPEKKGDDEPSLQFPRQGDGTRYTEVRPWHTKYQTAGYRLSDRAAEWPSATDAAALRELLQDKSPAIRAMAAEALATLHQPEDVKKIAALLEDKADAAPLLVPHSLNSAQAGTEDDKVPDDGLDHTRIWQKESVGQCAQRAIQLMTGETFTDAKSFDTWWKINQDGKNCLWYWQQRLQRDYDQAYVSSNVAQRPEESWEQCIARRRTLEQAAWDAARKGIAAELRALAPEVEAKVRLLTLSENAGGAPITGSEAQYWPDPPALRISSERLLDLLDRKELWADVAWNDHSRGRAYYNLMAERMGMWAAIFFTSKDVPRLRAALQRERDELWWSAQAAMLIGISRLLPVAAADKLDDPDTRDGALRHAISNERDTFARGYCGRELVRVVPWANKAFLLDASFTPHSDDAENQFLQYIFEELAAPPLTAAKRQLLIDLVQDPRFDEHWTRADKPMGKTSGTDMCRMYAEEALRAFGGHDLMKNGLEKELADPANSAKALAELHRRIAEWNSAPSTKPAK